MTGEYVQTIIKTGLSDIAPQDGKPYKDYNKAVWAVSKLVATEVNRETRAKVAEAKEEHKPVENVSEQIQRFMDNPMTEDEESRALRAIYQAQLSSGELSPQLLDKMDKIIGVGTGKDEEIQVVDFSDAFPDYATAIEYCGKPQPRLCECGGIINETT